LFANRLAIVHNKNNSLKSTQRTWS